MGVPEVQGNGLRKSWRSMELFQWQGAIAKYCCTASRKKCEWGNTPSLFAAVRHSRISRWVGLTHDPADAASPSSMASRSWSAPSDRDSHHGRASRRRDARLPAGDESGASVDPE